jgi:hypothetical protein
MKNKRALKDKLLTGAMIIVVLMTIIPHPAMAVEVNKTLLINAGNSQLGKTANNSSIKAWWKGDWSTDIGITLSIKNEGNVTETNISYNYTIARNRYIGIFIADTIVYHTKNLNIKGVIDRITPGQTIQLKVSVMGFGYLVSYGIVNEITIKDASGEDTANWLIFGPIVFDPMDG